eukprot:scaffold17765_cov71-Phaeocystis_antarctica.AAC.5
MYPARFLLTWVENFAPLWLGGHIVGFSSFFVRTYVQTRRLSLRPAGAPEASFSARSCLGLPGASASLGESAAWAALAGHTGLVSDVGVDALHRVGHTQERPQPTRQERRRDPHRPEE